MVLTHQSKNYMKSPILLVVVVIFFNLVRSFSQSCSSCTTTVSSSSNSTFNLNNGDVLCFTGGTFTGGINFNGNATICVDQNATFSPSNMNGFGSNRVINNYGVIDIQNSLSFDAGATINNYNYLRFRNNPNQNGAVNFNNQAGAYWLFDNAFTLQNNSSFTNYGTIRAQSDFSVNSGTFVTTYGRIETLGNFNPAGMVVNNGTVLTAKFININNGDKVTNNCMFIAANGFNNNDPDTENSGFIWVTGAGFPDDLVQLNANFINTGIVRTIRFMNGNTFTNTGGILRIDGTSICGGCNQSVNSATITGGTLSDNSNAPSYTFDVPGTINGSAMYAALPAYDTSNVTVTGCYNALPLTLMDIKCKENKKQEIQIYWETIDEYDVAYFDVKRSYNGIDFESIKVIKARNESLNHYTFTDHNPLSGNNYYRLDMVDLDGSVTRSKIIVCHHNNKDLINDISYNTQVIDFLYLNLINDHIKTLSVWSLDGQLLRQKYNINSDSVEIDLSELNAGMYIINIITGKASKSIKIIKY